MISYVVCLGAIFGDTWVRHGSLSLAAGCVILPGLTLDPEQMQHCPLSTEFFFFLGVFGFWFLARLFLHFGCVFGAAATSGRFRTDLPDYGRPSLVGLNIEGFVWTEQKVEWGLWLYFHLVVYGIYMHHHRPWQQPALFIISILHPSRATYRTHEMLVLTCSSPSALFTRWPGWPVASW